MQHYKKTILTVLTFLWVGVIFSFSLQTGEVSGDISSSILQKVIGWAAVEVFEEIGPITQIQWDFLHLILRKCAHFTEFAILGILSTFTLFQTKVARKAVLAIGFCLAIASVDETLQLFVDGRVGNVMDVLIDVAGAGVGVLAVIIGKKEKNI